MEKENDRLNLYPAVNILLLITAIALVVCCAVLQQWSYSQLRSLLIDFDLWVRGVIVPSYSLSPVGWYSLCGFIALALLVKEWFISRLDIRQIINFSVCLVAVAWMLVYVVSIYMTFNIQVHGDFPVR